MVRHLLVHPERARFRHATADITFMTTVVNKTLQRTVDRMGIHAQHQRMALQPVQIKLAIRAAIIRVIRRFAVTHV